MKSKIHVGMNQDQIKIELALYKELTGLDAYAVTNGAYTVFNWGDCGGL